MRTSLSICHWYGTSPTAAKISDACEAGSVCPALAAGVSFRVTFESLEGAQGGPSGLPGLVSRQADRKTLKNAENPAAERWLTRYFGDTSERHASCGVVSMTSANVPVRHRRRR